MVGRNWFIISNRFKGSSAFLPSTKVALLISLDRLNWWRLLFLLALVCRMIDLKSFLVFFFLGGGGVKCLFPLYLTLGRFARYVGSEPKLLTSPPEILRTRSPGARCACLRPSRPWWCRRWGECELHNLKRTPIGFPFGCPFKESRPNAATNGEPAVPIHLILVAGDGWVGVRINLLSRSPCLESRFVDREGWRF